MAIITKVKEEVLATLSCNVPAELHAKLAAYAVHVNRTKGEVVALALKYVLESDKEFHQRYLQTGPSPSAEPKTGKTRVKKVVVVSDARAQSA